MKRLLQQWSETSAPVWTLPIGWIILLPFLYFANNGNLSLSDGDVALRAAEASGSSLAHRIGVGLITVVCSALISTRMPTILRGIQHTRLLIALPLFTLLSSAWSQKPSQSLVSGTILLVFTVFAVYISISFAPDRELSLVMFAGAVALALSLVVIAFAPATGAPGGSWRGIFGHKQNCAAVATLLLVTAIHWKASGVLQHIFRVGYAGICCLLIVMSQSRTGWGLALIALCLSASLRLLQRMPPKEALLIAMLFVGAVLGIAFIVHENARLLLPAIGKDATLNQRTIIWAAAWTTICKSPILGYGYGAFWNGLQGASLNIVLISGWVLAQSQNGFLDLWLQAGLGCVLLIALTTAQAAWNAIRCFRGSGNDPYVRWCIVIILCTLIYNIGESSLGMVHLVWFLFLLAYLGLQGAAGSKRIEPAVDGHEQALASQGVSGPEQNANPQTVCL